MPSKACLPDAWRPAGIDRDALHQDNRAIRRDQIHWLEPSLGAPVTDYLARMEALRLAANRMSDAGAVRLLRPTLPAIAAVTSYATHRDAFAGRSTCRLTSVFHLSQRLATQAGGVLRMYDDDEQFLMDVSPRGGRLVCFYPKVPPRGVARQPGALQHRRLVSGQRQRQRPARSAALSSFHPISDTGGNFLWPLSADGAPIG